MRAGRRFDAGLTLLDRQLLDMDGRYAGNVDDLDLAETGDGSPPYIRAILSGPEALGGRLGGRLGAWIRAVHRRLHPDEEPGAAEIPFALVKRIGPQVELSASKRDLPVTRFEDWVREKISKIPGADREAE
jgi:sporulation protein YlmC with PRC-barrel domain